MSDVSYIVSIIKNMIYLISCRCYVIVETRTAREM